MVRMSGALALGLLAVGCTDEPLGWQLRVVKLEATRAFDPRVETAKLSVTVDVPKLPRGSRVRGELEVWQGGGIPVRQLSASKPLESSGELELEVEWDGSDRTGRRLESDAFEVLVTVVLERESGEILSELEPGRGRQLRRCRLDEQCAIVRSCPTALDDPERCEVPLSESDYVCSVVGGFMAPPPLSSWNFSGTDALPPIRLPHASSAEERYPPNAPAGGGAKSGDNPVVAGSDLGSPFEHTSADGKSELVFLFGDTQPVPERSYAHDTEGVIFPSGSVFGQYPSNDDALATSEQAPGDPPTGPERCLDLGFVRGGPELDPAHSIAESKLIAPVTLDGPLTADVGKWTLSGVELGFARVPGPGFSLDGKIFALMPAQNDPSVGVGCDASFPCAGGDQCLPNGACYYGDCSALDGSTPCFKRNAKATLAVRSEGAEFRSLLPSELETSPDGKTGALDIYSEAAEIIPSVAFRASGESLEVWARRRIIGHPADFGAAAESGRAELYYWRHPVAGKAGQKRIGLPEVFSGCEDDPRVCDWPKFSPDPKAAAPLYAEDRLIVNQTSVLYLPSFQRWVLIYGGRLPMWTRARYPVLTEERALDAYSGIYLRSAKHPWGPWSSAVTVYNPHWANVSGYCEIAFFSPTQAARLGERVGSGFVEASCDPEAPVQASSTRGADDFGCEYGAAIVPRFVVDGPEQASFFWLMSTWNPYRVVLMKTTLSH